MRSLIIDGIDTFKDWGLVLSSKELKPPSPKFYTVDVPGGNGKLNLTTALSGDTVYNNREQEFVFTVLNPSVSFEGLKTKVSNYLHGREFDYKLSWDSEYTYHGWFSVDKYGTDGILNKITVTIDADPYKYKKTQGYRINAVGGNRLILKSGRKPVRPIIETNGYLRVIYKGQTIELQQGSWTINDMIFEEGLNEVYLCSYDIRNLTWGDLKGDFVGKPLSIPGKNLMNLIGTKTDDGVTITNSENGGTYANEFVLGAGEYTLWCEQITANNNHSFQLVDEDGTELAILENVQGWETPEGAPKLSFASFFTLSGRTKVRLIQWDNGSETFTIKMQLEKNPTPTGYVPYQEPVSVENTYGVTIRQIENTFDLRNHKYTQQICVVDMGTLAWGRGSGYFYADLKDDKHLTDKKKGKTNLKCEKYETSSVGYISNLEEKHIRGGVDNPRRIYVKDSDYTSKSEFKAAMNGEELYYQVEVPIEVDLSVYEKPNYTTWRDFKGKRLYQWYKSNGNGTQVNKTWADLEGVTWEDLSGVSWSDLFYSADYIDTVEDVYIAYEWGDL